MGRHVSVFSQSARRPQRTTQVSEAVLAVQRLQAGDEHFQHAPIRLLGNHAWRRHQPVQHRPLGAETFDQDRKALAGS